MKSTDRLGIIIILLIVLACQLSLLQKPVYGWKVDCVRPFRRKFLFYSRGYLKYLMVEYRLFPVFIIKIRICVQIVNTGIFAKLKDKGYLNTAPAVL